jgi:hypothetical protein
MNERSTQVLLAAVGALLLVNLVRPVVLPSMARAEEEQIASVVRARSIELVDARGRTRAQLTVEADGEAVFRMRDDGGAVRVKLGASRDGSGLVLLNDRTEPGVHVLAARAGTSLTLAAAGKEPRVLTP